MAEYKPRKTLSALLSDMGPEGLRDGDTVDAEYEAEQAKQAAEWAKAMGQQAAPAQRQSSGNELADLCVAEFEAEYGAVGADEARLEAATSAVVQRRGYTAEDLAADEDIRAGLYAEIARQTGRSRKQRGNEDAGRTAGIGGHGTGTQVRGDPGKTVGRSLTSYATEWQEQQGYN